jgi:hypothetical protein
MVNFCVILAASAKRSRMARRTSLTANLASRGRTRHSLFTVSPPLASPSFGWRHGAIELTAEDVEKVWRAEEADRSIRFAVTR